MAKFTSELSGSLAFLQNGVVKTQLTPGLQALNLTGSFNITGSQLTVNGRNVMAEIDALSAGGDPEVGTLRLHSASMLVYTASNDVRVEALESKTGSIDQLNAVSSSYFTKEEAANIISSSNQIESLGFNKDGLISGSQQLLDLEFKRDVISGSQQIADLGFITSSNIASYEDLTDIPQGILSSSFQLSSLGYLTSSTYTEIVDKPSGIVSSSIQISELGFVTSSNAETTALNNFTSSIQSQVNHINSTTGSFLTSASAASFGFGSGEGEAIPAGTISSSIQISELGFVTSSEASADISGLATTGSNTFIGNQVVTGSIIPGNITNDLGTQSAPWQHLYISSGSIKFISPEGTEISSFNNKFDGNRLISNTDHPLFNSFNPGTSNTIVDFLDAIFYPNTAPTISTGNQTIAEYTTNGTSIVTLSGTDAESQAITFSVDDSYTDGYVIVDNGVLKLNQLPSATAFNTTDRGDGVLAHPVIIKATDTVGASTTKTIYIRVTPNQSPVFRHPNVGSNAVSSYSVSRNENASAEEVTKIYFTDTESDSITINSGSDLNGHFNITKSSNFVSITQVTASLDYESISQYNMSITASDSHYEDGDDTDSFTAIPITINVTDNTQPTVNNQTLTGVNENSSDGATAGSITATDPEGDTVTFKNARFHSQQLDGVNIATGSYGGTSQSDPTEDAFNISSNGVVTRRAGVYLNSDIINKAIYEVTVTDPYNNGSDKGLISIPIADDTASTISGDTTLYVIESATSGDAIYDNTNGYSGTTSRFTANQTVSWTISPSNDFNINSNGYLTLARNISGSSDVGGDQLSGTVTATNSFGTPTTQAFTVNITDNQAPNITFTNTSANLNTNKARANTNNLVTITFSDPEGNGLDFNSFNTTLVGDLSVVESGNSRIIRANSNLNAGNYSVTASISDDQGFATRTSNHSFTIAQADTGTLTTNGTLYIIESAEDGALIRTNSNGRTGTQADLGVSYSPNYGSQAVNSFTSSNADIIIDNNGNLSLGVHISGSSTGSGDTITSNITFQDQYNNIGSGSVTVNVVANSSPSVTIALTSGLEEGEISNGTNVGTISVADTEANYPITMALSGTDASDFSVTSTNSNGTLWNITANSSLTAGTYSFTASATDSFDKVGTDSDSITVDAPAVSWYAYMYEGGVYATSEANALTMLGDTNDDGTPDVNSTFAAFAGGNIGQGTITHTIHNSLGITKTIEIGSGLGLSGDRTSPLLSDLNQATGSQGNSSLVIVFPSGSDFTLPKTMANSLGGSTAGEYVLFADRVGTGINDAPQSAYVRYFDFDSGNTYPNSSVDRFGVLFTQGDATSDITYFLMASSGSAPSSTQ